MLAPDEAGFSTERLRLRPPSHDDIPALVSLHADPRTNSNRPGGPPTLEEATETVRDVLDAWETEGHGYWTVEFEGLVIGVAGLRPLEFHGRPCWNLYYRFSPTAWGKGLATEAVRGALSAAQAKGSTRPVVARIRPTNDAAKRLAVRVGLQRRTDLDQGGFAVFVVGW